MTGRHPKENLRRWAAMLKWCVIVGFLVLVSLPTLNGLLLSRGVDSPAWISFLASLERYWLYGFVVFAALWLIFLGGCFASFLNVVAWRLPRGKTLLGKSHCPFCDAALSLRENMPIIGWLEQGGESKCCGLPIASRYLLVELYLGLVFLLVGGLEIGLGGVNLPAALRSGITDDRLGFLEPTLLLIGVGHLSLLCLLFTGCLFGFEGDRVPISLFGFGILLGGGLLVGQEYLIHSVPSSHPGNSSADTLPGALSGAAWGQTFTTAALRLIVRGLAALPVLLLAWWAERTLLRAPSGMSFRGITFCSVMIAVYLGIPSVAAILVWVLLATMVLRASGQFGSPDGWLAPAFRWKAATLFHLLAWPLYASALDSLFPAWLAV